MPEVVYYDRIAQAEQAIRDAGFVRSVQRATWVGPAGKTAYVAREDAGKFYVKWS